MQSGVQIAWQAQYLRELVDVFGRDVYAGGMFVLGCLWGAVVVVVLSDVFGDDFGGCLLAGCLCLG